MSMDFYDARDDESIRQANLEDAITRGYDPTTGRNDQYPADAADEEAEWDFEDPQGPVHLCRWNEDRDRAEEDRSLRSELNYVVETVIYTCEHCRAWLRVSDRHAKEDFENENWED